LNRFLAGVAVLGMIMPAAVHAETSDPIGDLIGKMAAKVEPILATFGLKATLYHGGGRMSDRDSLGCKVVPMRTAAVDGVKVPRHSLLFIKETVGLPMPDGSKHDGYWYASDTGGAIHSGRIDLFTGQGAHSMAPMMPLSLATVTVAMVGHFEGCPKN
jgi:3D (Asp-Asp-Asp) domain-containing protein